MKEPSPSVFSFLVLTAGVHDFYDLPCGLRSDCCPQAALPYNLAMGKPSGPASDPVIDAYKKHVDRSLIRKNLKLTVEERILQLARLQDFAEELRRAGEVARKDHD